MASVATEEGSASTINTPQKHLSVLKGLSQQWTLCSLLQSGNTRMKKPQRLSLSVFLGCTEEETCSFVSLGQNLGQAQCWECDVEHSLCGTITMKLWTSCGIVFSVPHGWSVSSIHSEKVSYTSSFLLNDKRNEWSSDTGNLLGKTASTSRDAKIHVWKSPFIYLKSRQQQSWRRDSIS